MSNTENVELAKTTKRFGQIFIEVSIFDNGDLQKDFSSMYSVINISLQSDNGQYSSLDSIYEFDSQKLRRFASNIKEIELMQELDLEISESLLKFSMEIGDGFHLSAEFVNPTSSYYGVIFSKNHCKIYSYPIGVMTSEKLIDLANSIDCLYSEARVNLRERIIAKYSKELDMG